MRARVASRLKAILRAMNRLPPVCVRAHPVVRRAYPWCPVSLRRPMCSRSSCATCDSRWRRRWPSRWDWGGFRCGPRLRGGRRGSWRFQADTTAARDCAQIRSRSSISWGRACRRGQTRRSTLCAMPRRPMPRLARVPLYRVCRRSGTLSAAIYGVSCRGPWGSIYRP